MKIGNFDLNKDGVYIIAELSANHNGSLQTALDTIKATKEIGHTIAMVSVRADTTYQQGLSRHWPLIVTEIGRAHV